MGMSSSKSLDNKDLESLKKNTRYVAAVSPNVSTNKQLIYGNNNHSCSINGVDPSYLDIRKYSLKEGVMFTDDDVKRYNKVCVIGQTVVDALFTNGESPIGKTVRFGSIPMTVIGVLEEREEQRRLELEEKEREEEEKEREEEERLQREVEEYGIES